MIDNDLYYTDNGLFFTQDIEIIKQLIKKGADINKDGSRALHNASMEKMRFLISEGINIHALAYGKENALFHSDIEQTKLLISLGVDIHQVANSGETCLFNAGLEKTKLLISLGIDVHKVNGFGRNALFRLNSRDKDKYEITKILLEQGINLHQVNSKNKDPLCVAKQLNVAKLLIDYGANIELFKKKEKNANSEYYNAVISYYEKKVLNSINIESLQKTKKLKKRIQRI